MSCALSYTLKYMYALPSSPSIAPHYHFAIHNATQCKSAYGKFRFIKSIPNQVWQLSRHSSVPRQCSHHLHTCHSYFDWKLQQNRIKMYAIQIYFTKTLYLRAGHSWCIGCWLLHSWQPRIQARTHIQKSLRVCILLRIRSSATSTIWHFSTAFHLYSLQP